MAYFRIGKTKDLENIVARENYQLPTGEFLKTSFTHSFERNTLGLLYEEAKIKSAEMKAGTFNTKLPAVGIDRQQELELQKRGENIYNPKAISEEDFHTNGYDRGGRIKWTPETTEQRASIEAENFDKRRYNEELLAKSEVGQPLRKALGFGAAFLANIPDPINFVPFFGPYAKGASLMSRVGLGAAEGAIGTMVADSLLLPMAKRKGDDIDFYDYALDITFGTLIGGGIGAGSGMLHNRRVKKLGGEKSDFITTLEDIGFDKIEASSRANEFINVIADMPRKEELARNTRKVVAGLDRTNTAKLLDRTMLAISEDKPIDIKSWSKELGVDSYIENRNFLDYSYPIDQRIADEYELEQGVFEKHRERLFSEAKTALSENLPEAELDIYVNDWLDTLEAFTRRMSRTGHNTNDFLNKIEISKYFENEDASLGKLAEEEYYSTLKNELKQELGKPFWLEQIWGRLDASSLKKDYPQAYKEITKAHGVKLFKKNGTPVDMLADELVRLNAHSNINNADDLVELLKSGANKRYFQAAYKNKAENVFSFVDEVLSNDKNAKASFFELGEVQRSDGLVNGQVLLYSDRVTHVQGRHSDFNNWDEIAKVIQEGKSKELNISTMTGTMTYAFYLPKGDDIMLVLASQKGKSNTYLVETAFIDNAIKIQHWLTQERTTLLQSAGGSPTPYPSHKGVPFDNNSSTFDLKINNGETKVNDLNTKNNNPRGSLTITDEKYLIKLFETSDLSTLLHETGHIFYEEMELSIKKNLADSSLIDDFNKIQNWLGAKEGETLSVSQKEQFAEAFEAYLQEGRAPIINLQEAFTRFKNWLSQIYKSAIRGEAKINDDIRSIFDNLLKSESKENIDWTPLLPEKLELDFNKTDMQAYMFEYERLQKEGLVKYEDIEEISLMQAELKHLDDIEEVGLSILDCVVGI